MTYKKTFKERFQSATLYTALAVPVAGVVGGAWLGATSALAQGAAGAVMLGMGGAMAGLMLGGVAGAAGFVAANAIYKNKEYIALAVTAVTIAPFMLAARGLNRLRGAAADKLKKMRPAKPEKSAAPEQPPEKPAAAQISARAIGGWLKNRFAGKSMPKAEKDMPPAAPKNAAPKNAPPMP